MDRSCLQCSASFTITAEDLAFYDKVSPMFAGKKELIPPPTLCPDCRMQRRLAFRNERSLYRRTCDFSGASIIAQYPPDAPWTVYDKGVWHSDVWDPLSFGLSYDPERSFRAQWEELLCKVPRMAIVQQGTMENAEFCNRASNNKNCYLIFSANYNEDCAYGTSINDNRDCIDCYNAQRSELLHESIDAYDCRASSHLIECTNCHDSAFLFQCTGCNDCLLCTNLHHKQYCIRNVQRTREEYEREIRSLRTGGSAMLAVMQEEFLALKQHAIVRENYGNSNEHSSGNHLDHCRNAHVCFDCREMEDCRYCQAVLGAKDCMDFSYWGRGTELIYETQACGYGSQSVLFCSDCFDSDHHLLYCEQCQQSSDCFGCCGLIHKQYCILNKQYTKEEFEALVPKIIGKMKADGEYGEFFPIMMSPFAYNETAAQEYFPMTKNEVLARGWKWREQTDEMPKVDRILPAAQLPDSIDDIPDDILNWAIECDATKRPFKIIKQELEFYRQMRLPVPHFHPDERHRRRMALRNPRKLWDRQCANCHKPITTSYSPERPEIVYCESCYLDSVY